MVKKSKLKAKQRKDKRNKIAFVVLLILIIVLILFLIINLIDYFSFLEKRGIYAKIIVADRYGFDFDKNGTDLRFGMVRPGGGSTGHLSIKNEYGESIRVLIYTTGKIGDFISISDDKFILERNELKNISLPAVVPPGTEFGTYDGKVIVVIRKV